MQIEYEISEQDFLDAQSLGIKHLPDRRMRWFLRILPFWGLFLFACVVWSVYQAGFKWNIGLILPLSFGLIGFASPWLMKRARKKAYRKTKALHGRRSVSLDDAGMGVTASSFTSRLQWKMFQCFVEDDKTFILYQSQQTFHFIPKRQLSKQQIAEVSEVLKQNVPAKS